MIVFAEATVFQIDLQAATILAGGLVSAVTLVTKLFTGYLAQRDSGWQSAMAAMAANVATGQSDNKELVNVMIRLMSENAKAYLDMVNSKKAA